MRKSLLLLALAVSATAGVPEAVDPAEIPAYRLLRPGLAVAGQPSPQALARLGEMGFRTIVNLRTEKEGAAAEAPVVEAQGLRYVWIPVTPDSFSLADVEAVRNVLDDRSAAPVLFHCSSSNRVGGVWSVIQSRNGKSHDEALAAGRAAGLHSPQMEAAVRRVLGAPEAGPVPAPAQP
jgi:uncharacterized protein (TIGR01244 family)